MNMRQIDINDNKTDGTPLSVLDHQQLDQREARGT